MRLMSRVRLGGRFKIGWFFVPARRFLVVPLRRWPFLDLILVY